MNTAVYIAKRYLFSRKKMHAINIISGISMLGVFIGSAAFIIILSGFNGLEDEILSMYSNFTPEIKIGPRLGKTFNPNTPYFNSLHHDARVFSYTEVLQEKALIKYADKPVIGTIMGVSDEFLKNKLLDSIIQTGAFILQKDGEYFAVMGSAIQGSLSISVRDPLARLEIYAPNRDAGSGLNPLSEFTVRTISPSGVFAVTQDFDDRVVVPLQFARGLFDQPQNVSFLEINFKKGANLAAIQVEIKQKAGNVFVVKNRNEQNTDLYKTLNYERWFIFLILTFVLIIAVFNIIGSLTMLVIDKRKDIAILTSLGADKQLIQAVFFFEGMMISLTGCIAGIIAGLLFCLLQIKFGLIKMGASGSLIDAYPVSLRIGDFPLVFLTVIGIAVIASGISSGLSVKGLNEIKQEL